MISDEAVEAARVAYLREFNYDENAEYIARLILKAAAPHMLAQPTQPGSDAILSILEAAGVDKADQFDALVAVQKLIANPYRSQSPG